MKKKLNDLINKLLIELQKTNKKNINALVLMDAIDKYRKQSVANNVELLSAVESFEAGHPHITEIVNEIIVILNEAGL